VVVRGAFFGPRKSISQAPGAPQEQWRSSRFQNPQSNDVQPQVLHLSVYFSTTAPVDLDRQYFVFHNIFP
jgi:hypothetical protein